MKKLIVVFVVFILTACGPKLDENGQLAKQYLEDKGYSIKSYEGKNPYIFQRHELLDKPHDSIWAVQSNEPDSYIGKEITQEIFIVKKHPLGKIYANQFGFSSKAEVRVFIFNGGIIGGISFPVGAGLVGSPYSVDGQTAEEFIKLDYSEWQKQWNEKYGD